MVAVVVVVADAAFAVVCFGCCCCFIFPVVVCFLLFVACCLLLLLLLFSFTCMFYVAFCGDLASVVSLSSDIKLGTEHAPYKSKPMEGGYSFFAGVVEARIRTRIPTPRIPHNLIDWEELRFICWGDVLPFSLFQ